MAKHIHQKFTTEQVKDLMERYIQKKIERKYIQEILGIKRRRFFVIIKNYKNNPENFSIEYSRKSPKRISEKIEKNIIKELKADKKIIKDKSTVMRSYNYSYIKDRLENEYNQKVSLPTIIARAKKNDFYIVKKNKKKLHDREVLTDYAGELIQHDASYHRWAPLADKKWSLVSSLDDFSRYLLFAKLIENESSWQHINAFQSVVLKYGTPYQYYVDCHAIFRYVKGRDQLHRNFTKFTDDIDPQWKQVLEECGTKVTYALSPQAKGKIERSYRWLQDRVVRTCDRENIKDIKDAQRILDREVYRYNHKAIHSTTREIPYLRFQNALKIGRSLFREFVIPKPFLTLKDIFCLRTNRFVDNYKTVSLFNLKLKMNCDDNRISVNIRIYPLNKNLAELRFWHQDTLIDIRKVKISDLKGVHF